MSRRAIGGGVRWKAGLREPAPVNSRPALLNRRPPLLNRRQVLAGASAGAVASTLSGVLGAPVRAAAEVLIERRVEPLSIGYLEGSDAFPDFRFLPWQFPDWSDWGPPLEVVPADRMGLGDQTLADTTVDMTVHGLYPKVPPRRLAGFTHAFLTVFFPSPDPALPEPLAFYSWGVKLVPGRSVGARVRFPVPLRLDGGLEVLLEVIRPASSSRLAQETMRVLRGGAAGADRSAPASLTTSYADFTVDWFDGRPKLQRGIYLLGLAPRCWANTVTLPDPGAQPRHDLCSLAVSFERPATVAE